MSINNLVIIDNSIHDYQAIIGALQTNTKYILLDSPTDTYDTLKTKISELNVVSFQSVGIIQHNMGGATYSLFRNADALPESTLANVIQTDPNLDSWSDYSNFITYFKDEYSMENFDLMACALYSDPNWKYVIDTLETRTGVNIRASKDNTGSAELGGNWFLETDSVNLKNVYFTDLIDGFKGVLGQGSHFALITGTGTVYVSGYNPWGQLGLNDTANRTVPTLITNNIGSLNIVAVSCAYYHSLFLTNTGAVYSCGLNSYGQLGLNDTSIRTVPTLVSNTIGSLNIVAVAVGYNFFSLFLTNTGAVYSCGYNYNGQLGLNDTNDRLVPTLISNTIGSLNIVAIACGSAHSLFLTNTGVVYSCGYNYYGQLGLSDNNNKTVPTSISHTIGNLNIVAVAAGDNHSLFLTNTGAVYSCGYNYYGQLGLNNTNTRYVPTLITNNIGSLNIIGISCGSNHSLFRTNTGAVYGCGYNPFGQLGLIDTNDRYVPTLITPNIENLKIISVLANGYSSHFLTNTGTVYSCGYNNYGQLGLNNTANQYVPTALSGTYSRLSDSNRLTQYVSVGSGANTIAYSYDGITWIGKGTSIFSIDAWGVAYSANLSRWVAVGRGTNTLAYSFDGILWTGLGTSIFSSSGEGVAYSDTLNRWVAVGAGTNSIAYSTDGITWTGLGTSIFSNGRGVAYSSKLNRWVASGEGANTLAYSTDGITWTGIGKSIFSDTGFSSYYSSTLNRWVAVGWGTNTIAYSTDGITWTGLGTSIFSTYGRRVFYSSQLSRWVAVGNGYGNATNNTIAYSTDGITWTGIGSSIFNMYGMGIAYHQEINRWIAVGQGTNSIAYSTDGITWTGLGASIFTQGNDVASVYFPPAPTITWSNITKNFSDGAFGLVGSIIPNSNSPISYGKTWYKLGADIDGEALYDQSGQGVSISADGTIVAIGAPYNDSTTGNNTDYRGHVKVYKFNGASWVQLGGDIDGETSDDRSGNSVSLSADGTVVAIGAWYNGANGSYSGHVRVYKYDPTKTTAITDQSNANFGPIGWTRLGADIDGEASGDTSGYSVSLSSNGTIVAIGAQGNSGSTTQSGHVRVYKYDPTKTTAITDQSNPDFGPIGWRRLGADIDGEANYDYSGTSVMLSANGTVVAIGASGYGPTPGQVRVYKYDPTKTTAITDQSNANFGPIGWIRLGADIDGENNGERSGYSLSLSSDGTVVAIGGIYNSELGADRGHVRVYKYDPTKTTTVTDQSNANFGPIGWTRLGADINGEANSDYSGWSVSLSSDGTIVAIGARCNDGVNGTDSGHVRVYKYNPTKTTAETDQSNANFGPVGWTRLGSDIDGESTYDESGFKVSISSDGTIVAIGAPQNGSQTGHVRVYKINSYGNFSYTSSNTAVAEVYGSIVVMKGGGTTTLTATQFASSSYSGGTSNATLTVGNGLYSFTGHTFTNASATGRIGPTLSAVRTAYSGVSWAQDTTNNYLNMTTQGIQLWTVPATGNYTIRAVGAAGGGAITYGRGRDVSLNTQLTQGEVIKILVGQMGTGTTAIPGGGGGTFVVRGTQTAIIVAGGGGGRGLFQNGYPNSNASISNSGNKGGDGVDSYNGDGGTNGLGGKGAYAPSGEGTAGAGGGGLLGDGQALTQGNGVIYGRGGISFIGGGAGAEVAGYGTDASGGFGGGGSSSNGGGAGGGGYSGGGGGKGLYNGNYSDGGGGGSYGITTLNDSGATNTSNGYVTITPNFTVTYVAPPTLSWSAITKNLGDAAFTIPAPTSNSSGSFSYTSSNTSVASISGTTVTIVGIGTTTITATQAAAGDYSSGSITTNLTVIPAHLYTFTGHTFTNAGTIGRNGPTLSAIRNAYTGTSWAQDTTNNYLNMNTQGIQLWTVPQTGSYTFRAIGAGSEYANVNGGQGVDISTTVNLTKGDVIKIIVGQKGSANNSGGGGGATYAVKSDGTAIIVAGGGGGAFNSSTFINSIPQSNATTNTSGNNSFFNQ
jgi:alpha-tubulin suppressor-like RCC1 family protein